MFGERPNEATGQPGFVYVSRVGLFGFLLSLFLRLFPVKGISQLLLHTASACGVSMRCTLPLLANKRRDAGTLLYAVDSKQKTKVCFFLPMKKKCVRWEDGKHLEAMERAGRCII